MQQFSEKHIEKQFREHDLVLECPLKFSTPECGVQCIKDGCAWWMIQQRACAINVNARSYGYIQNSNRVQH